MGDSSDRAGRLMSFRETAHSRLQKRRDQDGFRSLPSPDREGIDLWSNDYLGLARRTGEAAAHEGSTGSRLLSGNSSVAERFESETAARYGFPSSLLFGSGYGANLGLLSCIARKGDVVLLDSLAHASFIDGAMLSFGKRQSFRHNDVDDLEEKLARATSAGANNIFVAVEAIYSMDGDRCPLDDVADVCGRYDAALIVDEAHSIGIVGERGAGLVCSLGLQDRVLAVIYTFGKAPGSHGAAIAGPTWLRDYLINFSRPFMYSTAPPQAHVTFLAERLDILEEAGAERSQLFSNIEYYASRARNVTTADVRFMVQPSPIQPVLIAAERCDQIEASLAEASILAKVIRSPTVAAGSERLRVCLHSFNTTDDIDRLFSVLERVS